LLTAPRGRIPKTKEAATPAFARVILLGGVRNSLRAARSLSPLHNNKNMVFRVLVIFKVATKTSKLMHKTNKFLNSKCAVSKILVLHRSPNLSRHATTTLYLNGFVYQQTDTIISPTGGIDTLQPVVSALRQS